MFRLEEELAELFGRRVDVMRKALLRPLVRDSVLREAAGLYQAGGTVAVRSPEPHGSQPEKDGVT